MTKMRKGTARLVGDFNNVRDGKTLVAGLDYEGSASLPEKGDRVVVYDPEGNECDAVVVSRVGEDHFRVRLDWDTWIDGEEATVTPVPVVDLMDALRASLLRAGKTESAEVQDFNVKIA